MKIETPKFTVEYKGAKFTFKFGTQRDLVEIIKASRGEGQKLLTEYFIERLIKVEGLEIDGKEAGPYDVLDLPTQVINEIIGQWQQATIDKINGTNKASSKKKKSTRKSKTA